MKTPLFVFLAIFASLAVMAQSQLNCDFTVASKACVNQQVMVTYTGGASANATYVWNFDGGVVILGSGQGPYKLKWETVGEKHITLTINFEGLTCTATRPVVVIEQPQMFAMTGGGVLTPGSPGVEVGLSGSETGIIYKLRRGSEYTGIVKTGTGSALSFGLQTVAGNYNAMARVDGSDCMREMEGMAIVTSNLPPAILPICMVTFDTVSNLSKIVWNKPPELSLHHVNIYRETYQSNQYQKIGETLWSAPGYFLDAGSNPLIKSDKFRISVTDSLGNESEKGPFHKTIHLNVNPGILGFNLIWNPYEGFEYYTLRIHRKQDNGSWSVIDSVAGNVTSYTDFYSQSGLMHYFIEVVRPVLCSALLKSGETERLISNVAVSRPYGTDEHTPSGIAVYPNPVQDFLTVEKNEATPFLVELLRADGSLISRTEFSVNRISIPMSTVSPGLYLVKITGSQGILFRKVVKN